MKTSIKTPRCRKIHLVGFSMSKLSHRGEGSVVRAQITKTSAAQVVAEVSVQAVTSKISKHPLKYRYIQKVRAVTPIGYSPNGMI